MVAFGSFVQNTKSVIFTNNVCGFRQVVVIKCQLLPACKPLAASCEKMSLFKSLILGVLGLLLAFFLIFSIVFLDPGGNIMARLWRFEVPDEVSSVNSNIDMNDKNLILQIINNSYKDGKRVDIGGNVWYSDSCFSNYLLDYKIHSQLKLKDSKIYFVIKLSQNANKCVSETHRSDNIIELVPFYISDTNKCFLIGAEENREDEFYYKLNKLEPSNRLYNLFCETKTIGFLKRYKYYDFTFLGLKIKSDEFATNIKNDLQY